MDQVFSGNMEKRQSSAFKELLLREPKVSRWYWCVCVCGRACACGVFVYVHVCVCACVHVRVRMCVSLYGGLHL